MKPAGALAAAVMISLSGCSVVDDVVVQRAAGSVLVASAAEPDAYLLAVIAGTLTRTDRGCLALAQGDPGAATPFVFPHGSKLAADGESVEVPHVGVIRVGDHVQAGGGVGSLADLTGVPSECEVGADVLVWN